MEPEFSGHVLIIEDEPVIALELEILLGDLGFRSFDIADCPADALACAQAHRPELITAAVGEIPVVYVTGNGDMLPPGAARTVVDKPISPTALAAACVRARRRGELDG